MFLWRPVGARHLVFGYPAGFSGQDMRLYLHARLTETLGIGLRFISHRALGAGDKQGGCQTSKTRTQGRRGVGVGETRTLAQIMLPAIRHRLDGAFRAILAERRRGEAGVEHGRKQYLTLELGQILIARHEGYAGSNIAARLFTGDEQHRLLVR